MKTRRTELEDAGVLQKELALLGKEQVETRQVDLLVIRLHLGEVGVDGEVEHLARRQSQLRVEADRGVPSDVAVRLLRVAAARLAENVGLDVEVETARQRLEPCQFAGSADAVQSFVVPRP